jgi:hypothetical protein
MCCIVSRNPTLSPHSTVLSAGQSDATSGSDDGPLLLALIRAQKRFKCRTPSLPVSSLDVRGVTVRIILQHPPYSVEGIPPIYSACQLIPSSSSLAASP